MCWMNVKTLASLFFKFTIDLINKNARNQTKNQIGNVPVNSDYVFNLLIAVFFGVVQSKFLLFAAVTSNTKLVKCFDSVSADSNQSVTEVNMPIQMGNSNPLSISSNGKRKSAFSLYKPTATVLTNLQRGNTEASVQAEVSLSFHERAGQGEITDMQARQMQFIDEIDKNNLTPLHWACYYGQISSVRILINCGADVTKLAPDHVSPLLLAAAGGHHDVVKLILQHGADPDQTDIVGNTALMFAAAGNHPHTCHELLHYKPNIFQANENDETAYSLSVQNNASLAQSVIENHIVSLLTS